jgi:hypothetical protein
VRTVRKVKHCSHKVIKFGSGKKEREEIAKQRKGQESREVISRRPLQRVKEASELANKKESSKEGVAKGKEGTQQLKLGSHPAPWRNRGRGSTG